MMMFRISAEICKCSHDVLRAVCTVDSVMSIAAFRNLQNLLLRSIVRAIVRFNFLVTGIARTGALPAPMPRVATSSGGCEVVLLGSWMTTT
jgi:hypothetical protein